MPSVAAPKGSANHGVDPPLNGAPPDRGRSVTTLVGVSGNVTTMRVPVGVG